MNFLKKSLKELKQTVFFKDPKINGLEVLTSSSKATVKNFFPVMISISFYLGLPIFLISIPPFLFLGDQISFGLEALILSLIWIIIAVVLGVSDYFYIKLRTKSYSLSQYWKNQNKMRKKDWFKVFLVPLLYFFGLIILGIFISIALHYLLPLSVSNNTELYLDLFIIFFPASCVMLYKHTQTQFGGFIPHFDPHFKKGENATKASIKLVHGAFLLSFIPVFCQFLIGGFIPLVFWLLLKNPALAIVFGFYALAFSLIFHLEFFFALKKSKNEDVSFNP